MKHLKNFEEYLEEGIAKKQSPDTSRAKSLVKEARNSHKFLMKVVNEIGVSDENADNIIKSSYDIVMELVRVRMMWNGFKSSGQGAHMAEVSYLRKLEFREKDVKFLNKLRYFRNGILYYGKSFDSEYAEKVLDFLDKIYQKLKALPKT